jgi:hypothetical protein
MTGVVALYTDSLFPAPQISSALPAQGNEQSDPGASNVLADSWLLQ